MKVQSDFKKLTLGFSPCPNDTFIFAALVHGRIDTGDIGFSEEILADVETLNTWALAKKLDITKISFSALGHVLQEYSLLPAGCALGRGCGPLLVAARPLSLTKDTVIGIPGRLTTAAILLQLFHPECQKLVPLSFESIMPMVAAGELDAGVIIHESRFTYPLYGLSLVQDLGVWWEEQTGLPVPLGGIVARCDLGDDLHRQIAESIRASLRLAWAAPEKVMPYIVRHAQEMEEKVIKAHIDLYVNDFTLDLGDEGKQAVDEFLSRGRAAGILPPG